MRRSGPIVAYQLQHREARFVSAYMTRLRSRIERLSDDAHRYRLRPELGEGRRALVEPPYLVFYRIEADRVLIQRILHGARKITPDAFPN